MNVRSLSIEKADELLTVTQCVCVTETWFKDYLASESVGLAGYCCERKDRVERIGEGGGGGWGEEGG